MDHVSGGDEVDVMAAQVLERDHHAGEVPAGDFLTAAHLRNVTVLAEDAFQIAVGEKDSAGPVSTDQGRLLSEVGTEGGDNGLQTASALTVFCLSAVHTAIAGAKTAFPGKGPNFFKTLFQFTRLRQ